METGQDTTTQTSYLLCIVNLLKRLNVLSQYRKEGQIDDHI